MEREVRYCTTVLRLVRWRGRLRMLGERCPESKAAT